MSHRIIDRSSLFRLCKLYHLVSSWPGDELKALLHEHYGQDERLLRERVERLRVMVSFALDRWGDREVLVVRVPARVNLMGVHVDHRGGYCNYLTFARETFFLAARREDNTVTGCNVDQQYPHFEFSITDEFPGGSRGDWMRFICSACPAEGHWSNYLKGTTFRIQDLFPDRELRGFDACVYGDIPPGAGLSSSSSLAVGAAIVLDYFNGLGLSRPAMVPLCAEGEWYVGTRGGAGDHAAMLLGRRGVVTHVRFFPMEYRYAPLPPGHSVVVCHSGVQAQKAAEARETFNLRIAGYALALLWVKEKFPQYADRLQHIRDLNPETLRVDHGRIYEIVRSVPVSISCTEIGEQLPGRRREIEQVLATFGRSSQPYPLREILLFGVAECRRSQIFADLLDRGDVLKAGRLMSVSHDGDRVSRWENGRTVPYRSPYDDAYLSGLAEDIRSGDPGRSERAALEFQPGGYRCSIPDLDRMVDISMGVEGVVGATLTGAGLGGCILVLVRSDAVAALWERLLHEYYQPLGRDPFMEICVPVAGAGILEPPKER